MELLDLIKERRSIRKYKDLPVEREKLNKIAEAGIYAPTPGAGEKTKIIILTDKKLIEEIGILNANCENRNWSGRSVSVEQPSIIDDLSIKSGFYGCSALAIICIDKERRHMVNGVGGAFVVAENMVLEAQSLGVSSCIVGRAEATFKHNFSKSLLPKWGMEDNDLPILFVCLGYIDGEYPKIKKRKQERIIFVEE